METRQLRRAAERQTVKQATTEEILVNEMAEQFWRIRRFRSRETCYMLLEDPEHGAMAELELIPMIQRLMSAAERGFHKALTTLRQLCLHACSRYSVKVSKRSMLILSRAR